MKYQQDKSKSDLNKEINMLIRQVQEFSKTEKAQREREKQLIILTRAVEQSPASIVITNTDGDIEYVNPKFTKVTGYTENEAIGENPRVLKSGKQGESFYKELWQTITAGQNWRGEFHNKKKNSDTYWEEAIISPILDEKGDVTHYLAVKEDITEQKRAKEELERNYESRQILNSLLSISLEDKPLEKVLTSALETILSAPFMPFLPKCNLNIYFSQESRYKLA